MTAPAQLPGVVMQRSPEPVTCMACGRASTGISVREHNKPPGAWTCDNPECIKATKAMVCEPLADLNAFEARALGDAAKAVVDESLKQCMMAFYATGARDLDSITAEHVEMATERLVLDGTMAMIVKSALMTFGQSIRDQIARNDAPF